ncbi:indole-3-glycerol phosphate synthase TrpC [Nicoliella lavandulae]|uniref:Indole-3-glycerol phosphate synthase n=1 Tax=Nicoliella lavandulae TaxID=3082954 RepID=A0ABU8SMK9_9LACO
MILDDLVAATKKRIEAEQRAIPLTTLQQTIAKMPKPDPSLVYQRFLRPGIHVIGEVKQASPSKGQIVDHFPYLEIAKDYDNANVGAISVLTEPDYFKGKLAYLKTIAQNVSVPVLRKDFTINSYMLYQARAAGAQIVLLIVAILTPDQLKALLNLADQLGLAAIVEAHDETEVKTAINAGAQMIGVNNRNLKNFTVSFENSIKLRPLVPKSIAFIAESGVKNQADIKELHRIGVNGVLIGETLMESNDREQFIRTAQERD